jgi:hypothetical protein
VRKLVASPAFLDRTVHAENVVAVHLAKEKITLIKSIYGGLAVLDLSKATMYDFYYNKLLKRYGDKMSLCSMDTDSYMLEIRTKDFYEDMQTHIEDFDTSNYPPDHKCFDMNNKKKLGKMNDEAKGEPISHFVGLRAKVYSYKVEGGVVKKVKGIKKGAVARKIWFKDYVRCLFNHKRLVTGFNLIRFKDHHLYSVRQRKLALSEIDDKRYVLPDGIHNLPHGHKDVPMDVD